jgi:hypothetical protein
MRGAGATITKTGALEPRRRGRLAARAALCSRKLGFERRAARKLLQKRMSTGRRTRVWLSWIVGLGLLAAVAPLFLARQHLPNPLATHFGLSGTPNGKMGRPVFALLLAGLVLLVPATAWRRAARPSSPESATAMPLLLGVAAVMSAVAATLSWAVVWHNWDRALWSDARPLGIGAWLPLLAFPLLVGGAVAHLARRRSPRVAAPPTPVEALPLEEDGLTRWSGGASNTGFLLLAGALVISAAFIHRLVAGTSAAATALLAVHALALILVEHLSRIRVSVDERGLTIHYGRLGWLEQRIGIERIAAATAFELEPWAHGGWGYRGSLKLAGRAAVVIRSGSAIRLDLRDGTRFSVTVDDAAAAARLLTRFVQRGGPTPAGAPS